MKQIKNKNQDEKLVDKILEKIKKGLVGQPETVEKKPEISTASQNARRLTELRQRKEQAEAEKQKQKSSKAQAEAKSFIDEMTESEETVFNEMMEAVNVETEKQRIDNLAAYIKRNRKRISARLIVNLNYFPYLQKYYILADAELRHNKVNGSRLGKGYFRLLPKGSSAKARVSRIKVNLENKKFRKKIKKKIEAQFYVDIENPSIEEKSAITNLLKVSPKFKKLYNEYQEIK